MRGRDLQVLAVYHSHPTSEAVPSRTDLERNYSPEVVNLIVSLQTTEAVVRGWWLTAERISGGGVALGRGMNQERGRGRAQR